MGDLAGFVILAIIAVVLLAVGSRYRRPSRADLDTPLSDIMLDAQREQDRAAAIERADRMNIDGKH